MRFLIFLILLSSNACGQDFDRLASHLAGITGNSRHHKEMNNLWHSYVEKNLKPLIKWQKEELHNYSCFNETLFYPFSGPDIVHMMVLFPYCHKYIMVGLEATGHPDNLKLDNIDLSKLRKGINSLLNRSFFVTREMWGDFNSSANGVVIPILTLLKRMNSTVTSVQPFYISDTGIITLPVDVGANGIKITFKQQHHIESQTIYYMRKSLTGTNHGIDKYLANEDRVITYLKAAQYALFDHRFKVIRDAILKQSLVVMQDDSGIPFKYFNKDNWFRHLYGNYAGPFGKEFAGYNQYDLKAAYAKITTKPLPFSLGYGYRKTDTVLMKMVRKEPAMIDSSN